MKSPSRWFACGLLLTAAGLTAAPVMLVENGAARAVIVVPAGTQMTSAAELQRYVEKATGAKLAIVAENRLDSAGGVGSRIYIGPCTAASRVVDLKQLQPEGFVIKRDRNDLFIVGRDTTDSGTRVRGTYYGVCEFLERYMGVRWLMPGPLGEIVPKQATLQVESADVRQEPLIWQRKMREVRTTGHREAIRGYLEEWKIPVAAWEAKFGDGVPGAWLEHQRMGERVKAEVGHSYGGWWDRYHTKYPDIFAMQPNGTRINTNERERLCVSNPTLWDLVAKDRIAQLRENPELTCVSIGPNDGGGGNKFCSCDNCRAWDSPAAQAMYKANPHLNPGPGGVGPFPPISDRQFRYFNEVAKRIKQEMPDRFVGTIAYSLYKSPPASIDHLETNVIVAYVGPNAVANDKVRADARREFAEWGQKATQIMMRPNMLGDGYGMPLVYVHRLGEDLRFFADHGMRLTDFASCFGNWGTNGLDYYVMAKLLWDPYRDIDALVADYCRAAYGPGAEAAREYYRRTENLTTRIAATSPAAPEDNRFTDQFTDAELAKLREPLDQAVAAIGGSDPAAKERVQLLLTGLDYAKRTRELMAAAVKMKAGKISKDEFAQVRAATLSYYGSLAMNWAVAPEQTYRKIRMGLSVIAGTGRRAMAADADDP